jgi:enoyl-CoA hydratase/carnithine racemase
MSDSSRTASEESENILVSDEGRVRIIRMNRPAKKNALTQAMYSALVDALSAADADEQVRVLLLTGTEMVFSAGNDIGDFATNFSLDDSSPVSRFLHGLVAARKPIVAAVNGPAVGIGTTMLLHCDLVYCGRGARFQLPFVNLGLVPEGGSSLILTAMLGNRRAAELLLLGDPFDAEKAREYAIVNAVLADGEVYPHALEVAQALAAKPPKALRLSKQLLKRWSDEEVRAALRAEAEHFAERLHGAEAAEAMSAFMERRKPDFSRFA